MTSRNFFITYAKNDGEVEENSVDAGELLEKHERQGDQERLEDVRGQEVLHGGLVASSILHGLSHHVQLSLNVVVRACGGGVHVIQYLWDHTA